MTGQRCGKPTKAGTPCRAWAIHESDTCLAHADEETREAAGFVADNGCAGRPRTPRLVDVMRGRIENAVDQILKPYFQALGIVGWAEDGSPIVDETQAAMEVGRSNLGKVFLTDIPDLGARIAAAEKLVDRVYGRPKQATELSGPDGGPLALEAPAPIPTDAEFHRNVAQILAEAEVDLDEVHANEKGTHP